MNERGALHRQAGTPSTHELDAYLSPPTSPTPPTSEALAHQFGDFSGDPLSDPSTETFAGTLICVLYRLITTRHMRVFYVFSVAPCAIGGHPTPIPRTARVQP